MHAVHSRLSASEFDLGGSATVTTVARIFVFSNQVFTFERKWMLLRLLPLQRIVHLRIIITLTYFAKKKLRSLGKKEDGG